MRDQVTPRPFGSLVTVATKAVGVVLPAKMVGDCGWTPTVTLEVIVIFAEPKTGSPQFEDGSRAQSLAEIRTTFATELAPPTGTVAGAVKVVPVAEPEVIEVGESEPH